MHKQHAMHVGAPRKQHARTSNKAASQLQCVLVYSHRTFSPLHTHTHTRTKQGDEVGVGLESVHGIHLGLESSKILGGQPCLHHHLDSCRCGCNDCGYKGKRSRRSAEVRVCALDYTAMQPLCQSTSFLVLILTPSKRVVAVNSVLLFKPMLVVVMLLVYSPAVRGSWPFRPRLSIVL